ncbi:DNA translocase FtsK [Apilactobacillus kunkeei]|uniref:DNA translocase FtsK n=1 Tax=Apilactobacillus kunkeei TaxID=148814 RepID=A0A0N8IHJ5_9LACO|nr:DNA translocase FtsK [Apilactobacillus kunkeei]KPN81975.1 Cell division protein FtsK/SpoIIIE [Apilactobacillus kunkeei]
MEHYDGPAFYRKYNVLGENNELKHNNKSNKSESRTNRDATVRQNDDSEDYLLLNRDNPIAKRAAAFKPSHNSTSGSKVQFYQNETSSKFRKIMNQLDRHNEELIGMTSDDTGAIDLDREEISTSEDESIATSQADAVDKQSIEQFNDIEAEPYSTPYIDRSKAAESEAKAQEAVVADSESVSVSDTVDDDTETSSNEVPQSAEQSSSSNQSSFDKFMGMVNHDADNQLDSESENDNEDDTQTHDYYDDESDGDSYANSDSDVIISSHAEVNNSSVDEDTTQYVSSDYDVSYNEAESDEIDATATKTSGNDDNEHIEEPHEEKRNIENHGLGHSLASILNQEQNVQKDLSIFNDRPVSESDVSEEDDIPEEEYHHDESVSADYDDKGYQFPSMNLLEPSDEFEDDSMDDWIENQAEILDETLRAFNVDANVVDWTNGPTVTQFQIKLQLGVKVSKITNLTDDLKLALAAKDIRIEAPIPGKTTVGIEIPNPKPRPVRLSEVLDTPQFEKTDKPLTVALGVDLTGKPQMTDLSKMPHGLIAGATGSGKSVFLNSLLISLLYKATPAQLKMILIDPKAVEMAPYDKLPHLLSPVISDPKQASAALKWSVKEMDERYEKLAAAGARNIEQFNQMAEQAGEYTKKMPYILIVIDELADLMMVASNEVQDYIVRITQKARAAGIHLIVATQRPSVDIITGTIKNNIPTRVAFMVSSQVDSRTIIDTAGAERLLGKGDMLYLGNGASQSARLQGTFVTNDEIERVTDEVRKQGEPKYAFQPDSLLKSVNQVEQQDELMPDVLEYISNEETVSTSKLQRVFSIGYNRAASLIDELEKHNYVSGQHGSKPRDVYLTESDYKKLNI